MIARTTALFALLAVCGASAPAFAQNPTGSFGGFGGMSINQFSMARANFGINVGKELTPNMQAIGEFGYIGDMLPPLTADVIALSPYDLRVSAYYGEGGVRLLAAPGSGVNPYFEATAGIARLIHP